MACAPSEDSDQPGQPLSLIRVFAVRLKKARILSCPLSAQQRPWSDWADAQADLSLRWAHMPFCWFCHDAALMVLISPCSATKILKVQTPEKILVIILKFEQCDFITQGERGGSVVECRTPEVRGSRPTAAVLCPWARHFTPRKYWLITQEAMAPSRYDWKIVDWDVKPQQNQPNYYTKLHPKLADRKVNS